MIGKYAARNYRTNFHSFLSHSYKFVIVVTACEKFMQGVNYSYKNLWDSQLDHSVSYIYDHPNFTAAAICYAIYFPWNAMNK